VLDEIDQDLLTLFEEYLGREVAATTTQLYAPLAL
jgi:hypothetical protein